MALKSDQAKVAYKKDLELSIEALRDDIKNYSLIYKHLVVYQAKQLLPEFLFRRSRNYLKQMQLFFRDETQNGSKLIGLWKEFFEIANGCGGGGGNDDQKLVVSKQV